MRSIIQIVLAIAAIALTYLVYNSIASKIELEKDVLTRREAVIEKLKQIRDAQSMHKNVTGNYAGSFNQLEHFLRTDSIPLVKAIGEVPDSLLGQTQKALEMGIISRDTAYVAVKDSMFKENFEKIVANMPTIPYSDGEEFIIKAGEVERGKVMAKVFEVSAPIMSVYKGLKVENEGINLDKPIAVRSMEEPTTNGNWE